VTATSDTNETTEYADIENPTAREDVPALIAEANKALAENQWTSGWGVESLADRLAGALEAERKRAEEAERAAEDHVLDAEATYERMGLRVRKAAHAGRVAARGALERLAGALEAERKRADAAIRAGEGMNASADILDERIYSLTQERDALAARIERLETTLADAADSEATAVHRADRLQSRLAEVEQERDALAGAQRAASPAVTDGMVERAAEALIDASFGQELPEAPIDLARAALEAALTAPGDGGES